MQVPGGAAHRRVAKKYLHWFYNNRPGGTSPVSDYNAAIRNIPPRIDDALPKFGPPSLVQNERRQYDLWNSWLLLLAIAGVAIAEWALRKKVSLP